MEEDKKTERKRKRFAARLKISRGINCIETAGPNLVLCNVGQATGFRKENLLQLIKENGLEIQCPKFVAEKGESHSFLVFKNTESATLFNNVLNGKAKVDENGTIMYINYVQNVPNTEIIYPYEDPEGLTLLENFITVDEEILFIKLFDWGSEIDAGSLKNRQVKHYGYEFRYGSNDVDLENPLSEKIPDECSMLWKRLGECGYSLGEPDQLTVNKYSPGQGIPSHVDRHSPFGSTILSLSLGSCVVMDWKHHSGKHVPVLVPGRSLLIMQDEARYDWQHGIQPCTFDPVIEYRQDENGRRIKIISSETVSRQTRVSLTFRWTRRGPCDCVYKTLCDSAVRTDPAELDDGIATNLEELHVHQVYEQIAGHFSVTRHTAWPGVAAFHARVPRAAAVLDLGAGNGKNVLPRLDILQVAGERSGGLAAECKQHVRGIGAADCVRLDLLHCGLRDACADVVICIAVVHHFSTKSRRLQAISTIHRLLRPSGEALITVWARDQTRSNYLLKSKVNRPAGNVQLHVAGVNLHVHENRTQFQHQDLLVPWKLRHKNDNKLQDKSDNTLLRYYHVFEEGELEELCREVGFGVERSYYEEGNWCVELNPWKGMIPLGGNTVTLSAEVCFPLMVTVNAFPTLPFRVASTSQSREKHSITCT